MRSQSGLAYQVVVLCCLLLSSCTYMVPIETTIPSQIGQRPLPAKVEIVVPFDRAARTYERSGMVWLGWGNTWKFEIGREVVRSSEKLFRLFFERVDVNEVSKKGTEGYLLTIEPAIGNFSVMGGSMTVSVDLHYVITDAPGKIVWQSTVHGASSMGGPQWLGVFFGAMAGEYALSDSANDAFNQAYEKVIDDLKRAVRLGVFDIKT